MERRRPTRAAPQARSAIDRRAFLKLAGASALALAAAGCGGGTARKESPKQPIRARPGAPGAPAPATLEEAIRGRVIRRGAAGFAAAAQVYNSRFDAVHPLALARPLDAGDVRGAIRWAAAHDVPLRARSGGHSYAGYSTLGDGVVLDLRELRSVALDSSTGTASVGAGAQLIDVYTELARRGVTIPAGSCPSVGVGGHVVGGGMGLAGRAFGLAADNVLAAEIVTADGAIRRVEGRSDPELLWALRGGGGGNFGVLMS